jgi:hypothetical protein
MDVNDPALQSAALKILGKALTPSTPFFNHLEQSVRWNDLVEIPSV